MDKNKKIIFGLVGEKAGGKGTTAEYFVEKYSASKYRFSQILSDVLDRLYLPHTRDNQIKLSIDLRKTFGESILSKVIAKDVKNDNNNLIVVDGIRREPDFEYLKAFENFYLIYITADIKKRYQRSKLRGEKVGESAMSFEEFLQEEKRKTELLINEIGKKAHFRIDNNGSLDELCTQIENILLKIEKEN